MPSPQRAEEGLPNTDTTEVCPGINLFDSNLICGHAKTDNDDFNVNGMHTGNLTITSSLHPFWHTKRGKAVIGLVVLTVVGAIVGGAIGGVKAHARQMTVSNTSLASATTTLCCSTSVAGAVFSSTTVHSNIVV